jgi:hypothetical protein
MCGFFEGRYRVPGIGYRLSGTGYWIRAEGRTPRTEPNPHMGYARCRIERARIRITWYPGPGTRGPGLNAPEELRS